MRPHGVRPPSTSIHRLRAYRFLIARWTPTTSEIIAENVQRSPLDNVCFSERSERSRTTGMVTLLNCHRHRSLTLKKLDELCSRL